MNYADIQVVDLKCLTTYTNDYGSPKTGRAAYYRGGFKISTCTKDDPFAGVKTWDDVRNVVTAYTRKKWPGMSREDIEDAVSEAIVDIFSYWVDLPSSIDPDNPSKNFAYACQRGKWKAHNHMDKTYKDYGQRKLDWDELRWPDGHHDIHEFVMHPERDLPPTPEDVLVAAEERDQIREAVEALDEEAREGWFDAFASGMTTREAAELSKVDHSTVVRRRQNGMKRIAAQVPS